MAKEYELDTVRVKLVPDMPLLSDRPILTSEDAVDLMAEEMETWDREHLCVLNVNTKGKPISRTIVSIGTLSESMVHPREFFKAAILSNAAGVILMHNHPSGDPQPSVADQEMTSRMAEAGKLLGIEVVDHIIVGKGGLSYSMLGAGDLDKFRAKEENAEESFVKEKRGGKAPSKKQSYRERVAQHFLESLKKDPLRWKKEWSFTGSGKPYNMTSGYEYKGGNAFFLRYVAQKNGFDDPRWITFNQAAEAGYGIPKGTKMTPVEYFFVWDRKENKNYPWDKYNRLTEKEKREVVVTDDGRRLERYAVRAKEHYVFNAAQLDGVPELKIEKPQNQIAPSEVVKAVSEGMGVPITEEEQDRAYYSPVTDSITLPQKEQFDSDYAYQSTALHELGHATGHESRLSRDLKHPFASKEYAYEELIAEIASCFMGEYLPVAAEEKDLNNHAAYIQGWMKEMDKDPNYLFKAIKEAEKAANYMVEKGNLEALKEDVLEIEGARKEENTVVAEQKAQYTAGSEKEISRVGEGDYLANRSRLLREIEAVLDGERDIRESVLVMDHTPKVLQDVGLEDKPILLSQKHVRNCLHEKGKNPHWHGLSKEFLSSIPEMLSSPAIILDSFTDDNSVVVVFNAVDDDKKPIVASITGNGRGQYEYKNIDSNYLTSVYGKDNFYSFLQRALQADFILYVDKEKTRELGNLAQLQLLYGLPQPGYTGIIHQSDNIVNKAKKDIQDVVEKDRTSEQETAQTAFMKEMQGYRILQYGAVSPSPEDAHLTVILAERISDGTYATWVHNEFTGLQLGRYDIKELAAARVDYYERMQPSMRPPAILIHRDKDTKVERVLGYYDDGAQGHAAFDAYAKTVDNGLLELKALEYDEDGDLLTTETLEEGDVLPVLKTIRWRDVDLVEKKEESMKNMDMEKKYIVLDEPVDEGGTWDQLEGIYDTLEEANKAAIDLINHLTERELKYRRVHAEDVLRSDLDDPEDWESFTGYGHSDEDMVDSQRWYAVVDKEDEYEDHGDGYWLRGNAVREVTRLNEHNPGRYFVAVVEPRNDFCIEEIHPESVNMSNEHNKPQLADFEVYRSSDGSYRVHSDRLEDVEDFDGTESVYMTYIMDEEEYDRTVLANSCIKADFEDWYGDKDALVAVIMLGPGESTLKEELDEIGPVLGLYALRNVGVEHGERNHSSDIDDDFEL